MHDTPSTDRPLCKCILIADDNRDIRETIEDALSMEGYLVYTAKNGQEALDTLRKIESPALVLLDLMMPVMNGWEFLDAQKQDAVLAAHQVITVSAVSATESLEDSTPLNTASSISKPINLEPLLDKVREFCGTPSEASAESPA
jgi:CheY-like chemotaxis protein